MRLRISTASASGPRSISAAGVAASASISSPSTVSSPHSRNTRSISPWSTAASSLSRTSSPASRNSAFRPISRMRRASSIRLPSEMRAIRYRTPAQLSASNHRELSCVSTEGNVQLVIDRPLRPAVLKLPLQARLAVVEFRNFRHHCRHVDAEQLLGLFSQLHHHPDRRTLPGGLIQAL